MGSTTLDYKCLAAAEQSGSTINPSSSDPNCHFTNDQAGEVFGDKLTVMNTLQDIQQFSKGADTPWMYGSAVYAAGKTAGAFISYDNEISASIKANYVKNAGLGGMMMWEIDGDIAPTANNFKTKSLVYSMYNCFHNNVCISAS